MSIKQNITENIGMAQSLWIDSAIQKNLLTTITICKTPQSRIKLHTFRRVSREMPLRKCHESFDRLQILPLSFIIENVSDVVCEQLLSTCSSVNTHHSDPNGPRSISNSSPEVDIISSNVVPLQQCSCYLTKRTQQSFV